MSLATEETVALSSGRPVAFRETMRNLAGGVTVVTVGEDQGRTGMTATSVSSFSAEPPTIILSINRESSSWRAIREWRSFCVNILSDRQRAVAENFAGIGGLKGPDRYRAGSWTTLLTGAPVLSEALANLDCELDEVFERHSHSIVIGHVRAVLSNPAARPLLYWHANYLPLASSAVAGPKPRTNGGGR